MAGNRVELSQALIQTVSFELLGTDAQATHLVVQSFFGYAQTLARDSGAARTSAQRLFDQLALEQIKFGLKRGFPGIVVAAGWVYSRRHT
jgi:hypothetical protein